MCLNRQGTVCLCIPQSKRRLKNPWKGTNRLFGQVGIVNRQDAKGRSKRRQNKRFRNIQGCNEVLVIKNSRIWTGHSQEKVQRQVGEKAERKRRAWNKLCQVWASRQTEFVRATKKQEDFISTKDKFLKWNRILRNIKDFSQTHVQGQTIKAPLISQRHKSQSQTVPLCGRAEARLWLQNFIRLPFQDFGPRYE